MIKKVNCRIVAEKTDFGRLEKEARDEIRNFKAILDKFYTETGFDYFCENDFIQIQVGGDIAGTNFNPMSWEATEYFLMFNICHLIEENSFDEKFPYYDKLANEYSRKLKIARGCFC